MLLGNADIAVHSLKDVPTFIPKRVFSLWLGYEKRGAERIFYFHTDIEALRSFQKGAVVGTNKASDVECNSPEEEADLKIKGFKRNI